MLKAKEKELARRLPEYRAWLKKELDWEVFEAAIQKFDELFPEFASQDSRDERKS